MKPQSEKNLEREFESKAFQLCIENAGLTNDQLKKIAIELFESRQGNFSEIANYLEKFGLKMYECYFENGGTHDVKIVIEFSSARIEHLFNTHVAPILDLEFMQHRRQEKRQERVN